MGAAAQWSGLNDARVDIHRSLKGHIMNSEASVERLRLRYQASTLDLCLFSIFEGLVAQRGRPPRILMMFLGAVNLMLYPRFEVIWNSVAVN